MFLPLCRAFYNFNIFSSMKLFIIFIFQIFYHLKFSIWFRMKHYQLLSTHSQLVEMYYFF